MVIRSIRIVLVAASGTLAVKLNEFLLDKQIREDASLLVSAMVATGAFALLSFLITELPLRFRITRRLLDPPSVPI